MDLTSHRFAANEVLLKRSVTPEPTLAKTSGAQKKSASNRTLLTDRVSYLQNVQFGALRLGLAETLASSSPGFDHPRTGAKSK
jgi:hypothetical protein